MDQREELRENDINGGHRQQNDILGLIRLFKSNCTQET